MDDILDSFDYQLIAKEQERLKTEELAIALALEITSNLASYIDGLKSMATWMDQIECAE